MKIGVLGAPHSGKSEFAKRLARNLNRDKVGPSWTVVDGYVDDLTRRTGCQYGPLARYEHNVQVMAERWTREAEVLNQGKYSISCGTIYETIIYAAMLNFDTSTEQALVMARNYSDVCMRFFGAMEDVTFNYDVMFYLPWDVPEGFASWEGVVDAKIPEVLDAQFKAAIELRGTVKQKVTHALETIRFIRDSFDHSSSPSTDDGQSV